MMPPTVALARATSGGGGVMAPSVTRRTSWIRSTTKPVLADPDPSTTTLVNSSTAVSAMPRRIPRSTTGRVRPRRFITPLTQGGVSGKGVGGV
ncbi:MAG: hypothetical protein BWY88_01027 [Synergistetes bacterium ADurb.Bin520]|nr:MAG: hypothetical protein BWY88_01027 [Synergistetes bacterium ADurb.Bin520]